MAHFLHLHDWLNATQALSYLKLSDIEVSVPDLVRAYTSRQFEMQLDFKDPATYVLKLDNAKSYPHSLFNVEPVDQNLLRHDTGELLRLLMPEPFSSNQMQRGCGKGEAVWIFSYMNDESFESCADVPVYIRWDGHKTPDYKHGFEMLTWGRLFSDFPNLLLFKREHLDSLILSERQAIARIQNTKPHADEGNKLGSKERNTLLILIAALCRQARVDYKQRGISAAIQKMTEEIGAPVTDDTINRVLKQIESALESRSK